MLSLKFFSSRKKFFSSSSFQPTHHQQSGSVFPVSGPAPHSAVIVSLLDCLRRGLLWVPGTVHTVCPEWGVMVGVGRVAGEEQSPDSILAAPLPPPISFLPSTFWLLACSLFLLLSTEWRRNGMPFCLSQDLLWVSLVPPA